MGEFEVKIRLRQDSVQSPLVFIAVLDLISRKTVTKDAMRKLLYADERPWWRLKISLEKTGVLHLGHQKGELDIELEGKKLT